MDFQALQCRKAFFAFTLKTSNVLAFISLVGVSCAFAITPNELSGKAMIDIDQPESCVGCHATVVNEWKQSMHSRAHHDNDPIYGSMRAVRMQKQGAQIAGKCAQCHNPRSPQDTSTPVAMAGVSCATCHNIEAVHRDGGRAGAKALQFRDDDKLATGRDLAFGISPVHPTGEGITALRDGETLCLACHDATKTPSNAAACTTGPEYAERRDTSQTCVSCHMPELAGPAGAFGRQEAHRSHAFAGPHRAWYQTDLAILEQAVSMAAEIQGQNLILTLKNRSAHAFPSGFPGRLAMVRIIGRDADKAVVWRNFAADPMAEDPQAVFNKVYVDENGKSVPAPFSKTLKRDNRLRSDETRMLSYSLPAEVAEVEVELDYRLLPGKLADFIGLPEEAIERQKRVIARVVVHR
jgi:nitrate/TMAO reductase-like tetraheme cytochrome c subunit